MIAIERGNEKEDWQRRRSAAVFRAPKVVQLKAKTQPAHEDTSSRHATLLNAVAARDRTAFAALFEFYAPRIKSMMMRGGMAPAQAEELAQETLLKVWRKAHLYNSGMGSAAAWIYTIARNRRIDLARSAQRAPTEGSSVSAIEQVDDQPLPDAVLAAAQTEGKVRAALTELSAEQQTVVSLSFFENRSQSEIADMLNIPLGTVKSRTRLAFQRLRHLLGELE